ncbi:MAG: metalloregulator ArsR/SmtB family transcription factor [Perlucidibaca sp.]
MKLTDTCAAHLPTSLEEEELARAFRALANPHRLAIYLRLLRQGGDSRLVRSCSLQALIDRLDIGAPTISHHVKELVNAGLITVEREGKHMRCTLDEGMRRHMESVFSASAPRA